MLDLGVAKMKEIKFDLSSNLNEAMFYNKFSDLVQKALKKYMGFDVPKIKIKGKPADVRAFHDAIKKEAEYMRNYVGLGEDDPDVQRSKAEAKSAIEEFEQRTGLRWPFK
jgi:hypothetical protein